jgi:hypothetical protein
MINGGCYRSAEGAYSSMAPDSTFTFVESMGGVACCPTLDYVFVVYFIIYIVNFAK